jgi:cyanophycin synthetase
MGIIEQRFLRGPNLWSSHSCLHAVLELGSLRHTLSNEVARFPDALLALLPGLHVHATALRRGCFMAEVVTMVMLEVQRLAGAPPPSSFAAIMMGRGGQTRIIVASGSQAAGAAACAVALAIIADVHTRATGRLAGHVRRPRKSQPIRIALHPQPDRLPGLNIRTDYGRARPLPAP